MGSKQSIIDDQEIIYGTYRTHTMAMIGSMTTEVVFLVFIAVAAYFASAVFKLYNITQDWQQWSVYGVLKRCFVFHAG